MVALYNAADRVKTSQQPDSYTVEAHYACTFAELVAFIEDTLTQREKCSLLLKLYNLLRLYWERLAQLDVFSLSAHSASLKTTY